MNSNSSRRRYDREFKNNAIAPGKIFVFGSVGGVTAAINTFVKNTFAREEKESNQKEKYRHAGKSIPSNSVSFASDDAAPTSCATDFSRAQPKSAEP
jgi:hypothetical protein